jgi:hypothetical protein
MNELISRKEEERETKKKPSQIETVSEEEKREQTNVSEISTGQAPFVC